MYLDGNLKTLFKDWQKDLELQIPKGTVIEESLMVAFNKSKQSQLKELEQFLQIVHDWIDESIQKVEASGVSKQPKADDMQKK